MARRYDHSREELRQMILDKTQAHIAEFGVQNLSLRKVAKEIGYSVGTIYNFFKDLDDLVMQMNGVTLDRLRDHLKSTKITGTSEAKLIQLARAYVDFTRSNMNLWNSVFEHHLLPGEEQPDWYQTKIQNLLAIIQEVITPYFDDQEADMLRKSTWLLWSSFHGICTFTNLQKDDKVAKAEAYDLSELLISNYLSGISSEKR
ncbi:TetR family transcriptional regulator [Sneathiella sp. P13V-1]|uniref:TetR/AcrR family transcriptional regulator n=1 Tax=Sneathiella sp. P13V-1 TaxID=2697366 RepID=UPI00187B590F|nr:TetR/AcrR family transcriptional regulator [Sneathiella sp. P13V-1]MBE7637618.1 TetR family transcriptional regulator [Sneathiella sp. P13V-1]